MEQSERDCYALVFRLFLQLHCDFPQFHDTLNVAPNIYCAVLLLLGVCIETSAVVTRVRWGMCVCCDEPAESLCLQLE